MSWMPLLAAGALAIAAAPAAARSVEQGVAFPDGRMVVETVRHAPAAVRVGGRRCAVGEGTPLAALVRRPPGRLRIRDFGSCSGLARDASGLFVAGIGRHLNAGQDGWVYKVGNRAATAGAGDPSGPFGRGLLRDGAAVTWFYCRLDPATRGCQRTLATSSSTAPGGARVKVTAHDDRGRAIPATGAIVSAGGVSAAADPGGVATLTLPPGRHRVSAVQQGLVPSRPEMVVVR